MELERFGAHHASVVVGWLMSADETLAWCGLADVRADTVVAWNRPDDVDGFVAIEEGAPVAYGELWVDDDDGEVELAHLIVRPDARGRGLGRRFVAELAQSAHLRHEVVTLRVVPDNEPAIRAYEAAGFLRATRAEEGEWNRGQPRAYVWMRFRPG